MKKTGWLLLVFLISLTFWRTAPAEAVQDCTICHGYNYSLEPIDREKVCYQCHLPHDASSSTAVVGNVTKTRLNYDGNIYDLAPDTLFQYHENIQDPRASVENNVYDVSTPPVNETTGPTTNPTNTDQTNQNPTTQEPNTPANQNNSGVPVTANAEAMTNISALSSEELASLLSTTTAPAGVTLINRGWQAGTQTITALYSLELSSAELAGVPDPNKLGLFKIGDNGTLTFSGGKLVNNKLVALLEGSSKYVLAELKISFSDMDGHWAKPEIELMAAKYIVKGYPGGSFKPENAVTRAEFAAMLVQAMQLPTSQEGSPFKDVKAEDWYCKAISAAYRAGVIKGFTDGTFRPNALISREEVAVMLAQALKSTGKASTLDQQAREAILGKLTDRQQIENWAQADLALAMQQGILNGTTATTAAPTAGANRAEAAVMIARFWKK